MALKDKMKNTSLPLSSLPYSSPWFWGIPTFALVSMLVIGITGSNRPLFLFINEFLYFKPDDIWINITLYGDAAMVMIMLLPLIAKRPDIVVKTFIAAIIATIFLHSFKYNLHVLRPPAIYSPDMMHQLGNQFSHSSFPSGHAAAPFTLAAIIIFLVNDIKVRYTVLFYASIIAISRVATGVHWPIDIMGGMFFGWFAAYLGMRFIPVTGENLIAQRIVALFLLLAAIHLVFLHDRGDIEARFLEVLTPIICFILSLKGLKSLFLDPIISRVKQ